MLENEKSDGDDEHMAPRGITTGDIIQRAVENRFDKRRRHKSERQQEGP